MRKTITVLFTAFFLISSIASAQVSMGISGGMMNYQGDLQPNSFTFSQSNFYGSLLLKIPINGHFIWRTSVGMGRIQAADRDNRDYLQVRNLSFYSSIAEASTGLELNLFDPEKKLFTPYGFMGLALFHFNPWTLDRNNEKAYLKPLSTEGQGLPGYPDRKPYLLTQLALTYALGGKCQVNDLITLGLEFNQRKTFTDYLDDVSSTYVDRDLLLAARGQQAVDLAYRGDELSGGAAYPHSGEQRGTASEKDWYYSLSVTAELKLGRVLNLFRGGEAYDQKCPTRF